MPYFWHSSQSAIGRRLRKMPPNSEVLGIAGNNGRPGNVPAGALTGAIHGGSGDGYGAASSQRPYSRAGA
jgi:hypothetical protein